MSTDDELDELLGLTQEPLPMRGDREDTLLDELLIDLNKGQIGDPAASTVLGEPVETPSDVAITVPVDLSTSQRPGTDRRMLAGALALAVAVALVVGFVVVNRSDSEPTDITDSPSLTTTIVTTTTEAPPVLSVEEACATFADSAPDRLSLRDHVSAGTVELVDLDALVNGLDLVLVELERRGDIDDSTISEIRSARGGFVLARANLAAGIDGGEPFNGADDRLRILQMNDPRFEACWRF